MANDFFTAASVPSTGASLTSATVRNEFAAIEDGFDKLPTMVGNGSKIIAVNSGGTALEALTTTGTGSAVRATSPTLVTPLLGTPTSGTLTNCTGLPVAGVSGLGSNVAAWLADPTSAKLAAALSDELGSGKAIFAAGTLDISSGKTLAASNSLTLAGTDGSTLNVGTGGTLGTGAFITAAGTTYTPTVNNPSNCIITNPFGFKYGRTGSTVVVGGLVTITTSGAGSTSFDISLPIASDVSGVGVLTGVGYAGSAILALVASSGTVATVQFTATIGIIMSVYVNFTYTIV